MKHTHSRGKPLHKKMLEFLRYIVAGNVLFLSTYCMYFVLHGALGWSDGLAMAVGSVVGHIVFFAIDKTWVFVQGGSRRKTREELVRFVAFMGASYFLNLGIVLGLDKYLSISPYIGQFVAAGFFTAWNYVGLKYWVFRTSRKA